MDEEKREGVRGKGVCSAAFCGRVVGVLSILFLVPVVRRLREQRQHKHHRRHFPIFGH
jgi:hypothetical protein